VTKVAKWKRPLVAQQRLAVAKSAEQAGKARLQYGQCEKGKKRGRDMNVGGQ
jgi:hypothetical protein